MLTGLSVLLPSLLFSPCFDACTAHPRAAQLGRPRLPGAASFDPLHSSTHTLQPDVVRQSNARCCCLGFFLWFWVSTVVHAFCAAQHQLWSLSSHCISRPALYRYHLGWHTCASAASQCSAHSGLPPEDPCLLLPSREWWMQADVSGAAQAMPPLCNRTLGLPYSTPVLLSYHMVCVCAFLSR